MAAKNYRGNAVPVSELATGILDPVLRRRAGISIDLVESWNEIVGEDLALHTRPERIAWPRRRGDGDPFEPATLIIACDGTAALHLQHETTEVIGRVNAFLGFVAIGRVRIVQKPVNRERPRRKPPAKLSAPESEHLVKLTTEVEDEGLRLALRRLGESVIGSRKRADLPKT